jgi:hypothetical protein
VGKFTSEDGQNQQKKISWIRQAVEMTEEENPQEPRAGDFPLPWKTQTPRFPHFHRYDGCYLFFPEKAKRMFLPEDQPGIGGTGIREGDR